MLGVGLRQENGPPETRIKRDTCFSFFPFCPANKTQDFSLDFQVLKCPITQIRGLIEVGKCPGRHLQSKTILPHSHGLFHLRHGRCIHCSCSCLPAPSRSLPRPSWDPHFSQVEQRLAPDSILGSPGGLSTHTSFPSIPLLAHLSQFPSPRIQNLKLIGTTI